MEFLTIVLFIATALSIVGFLVMWSGGEVGFTLLMLVFVVLCFFAWGELISIDAQIESQGAKTEQVQS